MWEFFFTLFNWSAVVLQSLVLFILIIYISKLFPKKAISTISKLKKIEN